eukprot:902163_1
MAQARQFHLFEVANHKTEDDAWIIVNKKVYDITNFTTHPGSHAILLRNAGTDRTDQFEAVSHPADAYEQMKQFYVGELSDDQQDINRQANLSYLVKGVFTVLTIFAIYKGKSRK